MRLTDERRAEVERASAEQCCEALGPVCMPYLQLRFQLSVHLQQLHCLLLISRQRRLQSSCHGRDFMGWEGVVCCRGCICICSSSSLCLPTQSLWSGFRPKSVHAILLLSHG